MTDLTPLGLPTGRDTRTLRHVDSISPTDDPTSMIGCEICRLPLNSLIAPDGTETWVHVRAWEKHDHEPVPVAIPRHEVKDQNCDFCGLVTSINWAYRGNQLILQGGGEDHDYGRMWAACDDCDRLLMDHDIEGLLKRVLRVGPVISKIVDKDNRNRIAANMVDMWRGLFLGGADRLWVGGRHEPAPLRPGLMAKVHQGLIKFWNSDGLYERLCGHGKHDVGQSLPGLTYGQDEELLVRVPPGSSHTYEAFTNFQAHMTANLHQIGTDGDITWIGERFTNLATIAGQEMDEIEIIPEQLPSQRGLVIYETPIGVIPRPDGEANIRGFSWIPVPGGLWVNLYIQGEDADPYIDVTTMRETQGYLMCLNIGSAFPFNAPLPADQIPQYDWFRTIIATWYFITQPGVAEIELGRSDKKYARAYKRTYGHNPPDVRLVDLRRRPARTGDTTRETGPRGPLKWTRYTPGHWRKQPYGPKRGLIKRKYISPFISGPEDAGFNPNKPLTVKVLK